MYLALVLAPLLVLLLADPPPGLGFWWDFAVALGFAGLAMMAVQFVLTARFRRATAPYGIDLIYFFHRYLAVIALLLIAGHAVLLLVENPGFVQVFDPRVAPGHLFAGVVAAAVLVVLVGSSLWRKWLRLPYEAWRVLHVLLAVTAVILAMVHIEGVGYYAAAPWKRGLWRAIAASCIAIQVYVRVVKPWRSVRRPYRVASIVPERGDAWTVVLVPDGHAGLAFEPGQFAWVTLRATPFSMREHPFSISSAPAPDGRVEVTIKELGDFTRTIKHLRVGETAYVDGPYGAFTIDRYDDAPGCVFIGGGIGMAPLLSMLRTFAERRDQRRHLLIMANSSRERATFFEEIETLVGRLDLEVVHVLEHPEPGWGGECGYITEEMLARHLPVDRATLEYFICGPKPMIVLVERALYTLDVPLGRCHSELFDLV